MIRAVAIGATLVFASPAEAQNRDADIAALTEAKLKLWPGFYRASDGDGLAGFLADGFIQFSDDGSRETKADAVAWVRANKWGNAERNFRYDITNIAFHALDVANVYGVGTYDGAGPEGACRMAYTSSNIFVRQAGRWRPAFSHTSAAKCQEKSR